MEQLWAHQFPLLLQKSLCKTSRNEPSQLTNEHYNSGYVTLTTPLHRTQRRNRRFTRTPQRTKRRHTVYQGDQESGKIPFLDCSVTRNNNKLRTTIYRKLTHIDRLLDQSSYNPTSHKATTIWTLTRRAQLVCDSPDSLTDDIKNLDNVFNQQEQLQLGLY